MQTRFRWRLTVRAGILLAMLGAGTWILAAGPASPAGPQIEIRGHEYSPASLTVPAGTAVTWINHGDDVHTVTSTTDLFHSPGIDTDETFTYTFTRPGAYESRC